MKLLTRRNCFWAFICAIFIMFTGTTIFVVNFVWDWRPVGVREFSKIRDDWERVVLGRVKAGRILFGFSPPKPTAPLTGEKKRTAEQQLAKRCLALADKHPGTVGELAALFLAASRGTELDSGKTAQERLIAKIQTVELSRFQQCIRLSRMQFDHETPCVIQAIAPHVTSRLKKAPDEASGAALLTYVCANLAHDSKTEEPPPQFTESADLLVARYGTSPDIFNFCETLGGSQPSPHWATGFESHLRKILEVNKNRWVRCTASLALASVVQLSANRQDEAEELYESYLSEFNGQPEYHYQQVERVAHQFGKERLMAMKFAPVGKPAPEIDGVDLDGKAMSLSEYRGKVVLMSFWSTWCYPCMKFLPHERELAARLAAEPFAIVGVNADYDEQALIKALKEHNITWRSFRDKRSGMEAISDEWNAIFPTLYLIDHEGIIRKRWTGTPPPNVLSRGLDELVEAARTKDSL